MNPKIINFELITGNSGSLSVASVSKQIPFFPKRVFFIYEIENENIIRGKHAHKKCHQLLIASSGSVLINYENNGIKNTVILDGPNKGLYLPPLTWSEQTAYTFNSTLTVLASEEYDESDYIRNYEDFINYE
jgi:UDP-2-acetamido-3-amino-2,3-dideoxy-glucuronate N-acetyltransferase